MKIPPTDTLFSVPQVEHPAAAGAVGASPAVDTIKIRSVALSRQVLDDLERLEGGEPLDVGRMDQMRQLMVGGRLDDYLSQAVECILQESDLLESWLSWK